MQQQKESPRAKTISPKMKIHTFRSLPASFHIAFSGGIDSCVLAHLSKIKKRDVTLVFYNHGNELGFQEEIFVKEFSKEYKLPLIIDYYNGNQPTANKEQFWRECRYKFFNSFNIPVATGHHLDDVVEWYLFTCLRGEGHLMEPFNKNVFRPLIHIPKKDILEYQVKFNIPFFDDPTNKDVDFTPRNKIRLEVIPTVLEIHPGFYSTIRNKLIKKYESQKWI